MRNKMVDVLFPRETPTMDTKKKKAEPSPAFFEFAIPCSG
ncbi:hypothetical protein EKH55_0961 [Sinorhizobium alkalisoli]|nr:hypothetical protein EKH55_0961 [Sinorhizobium alkalisoli]